MGYVGYDYQAESITSLGFYGSVLSTYVAIMTKRTSFSSSSFHAHYFFQRDLNQAQRVTIRVSLLISRRFRNHVAYVQCPLSWATDPSRRPSRDG